jgi:hypothetical protein
MPKKNLVHHGLVLHISLHVFKVQEEPLKLFLFLIDPKLVQVLPVEISFGIFMPARAVAQFLVY